MTQFVEHVCCDSMARCKTIKMNENNLDKPHWGKTCEMVREMFHEVGGRRVLEHTFLC